MINFKRNSENLVEATMNFNNQDTKRMVDYITSSFGIPVSCAKAHRGADIIYSKDTDPRSSFMILIDEGKYYLVKATEKEISQFVGTKRWKAANDKRRGTHAIDAIKNGDTGTLIKVDDDQTKAYNTLTNMLSQAGVTTSDGTGL